ncbi:hypothetical protein V6N13_114557 [Hibiscus sabdariffa]|uniref:Uncharacterized protein n=1 Tax=Hibiscus sabdariffa TaxID=183260 RepID=A0ABR2U275_9ROSI
MESNAELGGPGSNHPLSSRVINGINHAQGKVLSVNPGTTINHVHLPNNPKEAIQAGVTMGTNVFPIRPHTSEVMDPSNENLNVVTNVGFDTLMDSGDEDIPLQ